MTAPDTALQEVLLETKGFVQDLNHKQTLEAVQLGRRPFSGVPDAQHWIAGLGFVPVISNSPLDVLSGAYDYAGVIWGQDGGEPVSAAVFPVKSLPLDDIKSKRATIYLGQSMLNKSGASERALREVLDDLMGKSKAGEKEGHEFRGNQYKKKPVAPKAPALKPSKASAGKPGAAKKLAKKIEPPKKTPSKPAPAAKKPAPKPAPVAKPKPVTAKPTLGKTLDKVAGDMLKIVQQKPSTLASMPKVSTVIGPDDKDFTDVSKIGEKDLVLPKAKVSYDGNTYTMVGNTSGEHAKYFHLQSSAQKHADMMNEHFHGHTHEVIPFESMKLYSVGRLVSGTPHAVVPQEPAPPKPKQMSSGGGLEVPGSLGVPSQGKKVVSTWTNTNINDIESASDIPSKGEVKFKDKTFTAVPDGQGGTKVHPSIKLAAAEANMLNAMGVTHKKFMPLYLKQSKQYIVGLEKDPNEKLPEKTESMLIPGTPFLAGDEEGGTVPTLGGKGVQEAFDNKPQVATTNVDIGGQSTKGTPKNPYTVEDTLEGIDIKPGMAFADEEGHVMQVVSKPGDKGAPYLFPNTEEGVTQAMSAATHMSEKYGPYFGAGPIGGGVGDGFGGVGLSGDKGWAVMVMADKFNPSAKPKGVSMPTITTGPTQPGGYGNAVAVPKEALGSESSGTDEAAHEFKDLPFDKMSINELADTVAAKIGVPKSEVFKALSSHADPSNSKLAKIRVQVESAILKSHTAIKDAVQHINTLDDPKEKAELLEVLTTGDVKRAQLEYAKTPLYDLQCLSKITVYDHPVQGQANCNLETRSMNMGTTSVTGDFRHELGHAIHGALGATHGKEQTNPMLVAVSKHFETVKAAMKAHPEGMGTGKGEPGTPGAKMSHQWYMENYHIIGRRGADNWLEDFAELYRGYHKAAYMDSAQKVSGLKGGNLDEFRKYFPTIARLMDARYTAAIMGSMAKKGHLE